MNYTLVTTKDEGYKEKIDLFNIDAETWALRYPEVAEFRYIEELLELDSRTEKGLEELEELVMSYKLTAEDYILSLRSRPYYYCTVGMELCFHALENLTEETLKETALCGRTLPILLYTKNTARNPQARVANLERLYYLALESVRTYEDVVLIAQFSQQLFGVGIDKFIDDIEQKGVDFPYDYFIQHTSEYADYKDEKLAIAGRVRNWFLHCASGELVDNVIHKLERLSSEEVTKIYERTGNIFYYLDGTEDYRVLTPLRQRYTRLDREHRAKLFEDLLSLRNYRSVQTVIRAVSDTEALPESLKERLAREFENAFSSGYFESCRDLIECLKQLDAVEVIDETKIARIMEEMKAETHRPKVMEPYPTIDVRKEAVRYYLADWMDYRMKIMTYRMENPAIGKKDESSLNPEPAEFSKMQDRIEFAKIAQTREKTVREIFDWLKKYLFIAVNSETKHYDKMLKLDRPYVRVKRINLFSQPTTHEEITMNLYAALHIFENYEWTEDFGGEKWAEIAKLALVAWSDEARSIKTQAWVIDRAFDLVHNTGPIFDKDPKRVIGSEKLEPVLDLKFSANSPEELLEYAKSEELLDEKEIAKYRSIFDTLKRLETAPTRPKGYE